MHLGFTPEQEKFRATASAFLEEQLSGPFAHVRGCSDMGAKFEERKDWEQMLGSHNWSCIGWPRDFGGRAASLAEQVIFAEEYARARAPFRVGHMGVELAGPTILTLGTDEQRKYFLPRIAKGEDIWCQGYSEPSAGSDLSNVRTKARLEPGPNGPEWVIDGQKVWTSLAQFADWAFVICRTEEGTRGPAGLSYLLVPMHQKGVTVRPITQITGDAEFNEVFFDGARTAAANIIGKQGEGWKVANATLAFERGTSTLAQQMEFTNELQEMVDLAKENGRAGDPLIRQRLAEAYTGLKIMRYNALRMLSGTESAGSLSPAALTYKIYWATWHRKLGELAMDIIGPESAVIAGAPYALGRLQRMYLFSRADTIYAGTNQIQRNIISERALGLPKEPRGNG